MMAKSDSDELLGAMLEEVEQNSPIKHDTEAAVGMRSAADVNGGSWACASASGRGEYGRGSSASGGEAGGKSGSKGGGKGGSKGGGKGGSKGGVVKAAVRAVVRVVEEEPGTKGAHHGKEGPRLIPGKKHVVVRRGRVGGGVSGEAVEATQPPKNK
jgi:hypothetical protein